MDQMCKWYGEIVIPKPQNEAHVLYSTVPTTKIVAKRLPGLFGIRLP
jgi:hypothetical protein